MTNAPDQRNDQSADQLPDHQPFEQAVLPLLTDLLYPSESDEPLEPVTCHLGQAEPLTISQVKDWLMIPPSVYVEERPEAEFWEPVTTEQDWYSEEEKARTARFVQLKQFIEANLTVRQVFYVGETEIDLYLLGLHTTGERAGIKTRLIET